MGCEFAQGNDWNEAQPLDWWLFDFHYHRGVHALVSDLNRLYRDLTPLHRHDFSPDGFEWIDCHDSGQSVLSFLRRDGDDVVITILNFTPVPRHDYRIGVPHGGEYEVLLNSDSEFYGGSNTGDGVIYSEEMAWMNQPHSITLTLPPLGAVVLKPKWQ